MSSSPKISIVLYSGEHSMLGEMLSAFAAQTLPSGEFEAVIMDYDSRTDWTAPVKAFSGEHPTLRLQYHRLPDGTRPKAINRGVKFAQGKIIALLADDFVPCPDFAEAHLRFHEQNPTPNVVGVGRGLYPNSLRDTAFRRWLEDSGSLFGVSFTQPDGALPEDFFYAANTSLHKSFFEAAGGFDEEFPYAAWDDYEFGVRLRARGMKSALVAGATARHEHPVTLAERRDAMRESGAAAVIFERKHGAGDWHHPCRKPLWRHRAGSALARVKHLLTRDARNLEAYYQKTITSSFVAAYRAAKAGSG